MTAPVASTTAAPVVAQPASTTTWLIRLALLAILAVAALLVSWNIGREGMSNDYYAAAVRSMLDDPVAFLFAGFDGGRYITDRQAAARVPAPGRLRGCPGIQRVRRPAATARGIRRVGLARVPPRSPGVGIAGRPRGRARARADAGLRRRGTEHDGRRHARDGPLAWRACPPARPPHPAVRWLALAFALVGLGFELKMLQAYLVLPAFAAAWLVAARGTLAEAGGRSRRCRPAAGRGVVLVGRRGGGLAGRVPAVDRWQHDELAAGASPSDTTASIAWRPAPRSATPAPRDRSGSSSPSSPGRSDGSCHSPGWASCSASWRCGLVGPTAPRTLEPTTTCAEPGSGRSSCGRAGSSPASSSSASRASGTATTSSSWPQPSPSSLASLSASAGGRTGGAGAAAGCRRLRSSPPASSRRSPSRTPRISAGSRSRCCWPASCSASRSASSGPPGC